MEGASTVSKYFMRAIFLGLALLFLHWTLKDFTALPAAEVSVRFAWTLASLACLNFTFASKKRDRKITTLVMQALSGSTLLFGGFGYFATGEGAGIVIGIAGIFLVGLSIWEFYKLICTTK